MKARGAEKIGQHYDIVHRGQVVASVLQPESDMRITKDQMVEIFELRSRYQLGYSRPHLQSSADYHPQILQAG